MNETIFNAINSIAFRSEFLDSAIIFFADKFGLILLFGLVYYLFTHKDRKKGVRDVIVVITAGLLAWALAHVLKAVFVSPRPFLVLDSVNQLIEHGDHDSFPSGHASFFSTLAISFYFYHKRLALIYIIGALIIGFARVAAGIHWPGDILGGYILGGAVAICVYYGLQYINTRIHTVNKS